jgi:uncharacterized membrane protein
MDAVIAKYHLHPIIDHFTIALVATGIVTDMTGYIIALLFRATVPKWLSSKVPTVNFCG